MGDLSFQNNVPDPLLAGKELLTFKFELEKSKGKVLRNSFGKEVTVEQLPISKRKIIDSHVPVQRRFYLAKSIVLQNDCRGFRILLYSPI
jgi:hypothetical protein